MDGTMANGNDSSDDMERIEMLRSKMMDGTITDAERDELRTMKQRMTLDSDK
jgi:hypothetical protein